MRCVALIGIVAALCLQGCSADSGDDFFAQENCETIAQKVISSTRGLAFEIVSIQNPQLVGIFPGENPRINCVALSRDVVWNDASSFPGGGSNISFGATKLESGEVVIDNIRNH